MGKGNCKINDINIQSFEFVEGDIRIIYWCDNHQARYSYSEPLTDLIKSLYLEDISRKYLANIHNDNKDNRIDF